MRYEWADGFHPPKGVTAEKAGAAIAALREPSPEALLDASKRKTHVFHDDLWSEGDQVWAQRGRLERCRKLLGAVQTISVAGGREIKIRAVEFVRMNGDGRWATLEDIRSDPELLEGYLAECQRLQEQAGAKLAKALELMREPEKKAA